MIDALALAKVIIDVILHYYSIFQSIIIDQDLLFISKFLFLLCYFLDIKKDYQLLFTLQWVAKSRDKTA